MEVLTKDQKEKLIKSLIEGIQSPESSDFFNFSAQTLAEFERNEILKQQNKLLEKQNELISQQNQKLDKQNEILQHIAIEQKEDEYEGLDPLSYFMTKNNKSWPDNLFDFSKTSPNAENQKEQESQEVLEKVRQKHESPKVEFVENDLYFEKTINKKDEPSL